MDLLIPTPWIHWMSIFCRGVLLLTVYAGQWEGIVFLPVQLSNNRNPDRMFFFAGGVMAFFFEFLLLAKRSKSLSDKILAVWMFVIGLHLFLYYLYTKGLDFEYPHVLGIGNPLPLIHGPLLFLYTGSLTGYFPRWKPLYLLHFLPVLLFFLYYREFYFSSGPEKINFFHELRIHPDPVYRYMFPAIIASGFSYLFFTFLLFRSHRRYILNNLSYSNEKNNLHWLRNLLAGLLGIWVVVLAGHFLLEGPWADDAIYGSVTVFVGFIGFFGLRQGNIFINLSGGPAPETAKSENQQRYAKSGLKEQKAAEVKQMLIELMEVKKVYLDENVSLPQLAGILNIHPNYLSQVINEGFRKNFYDYINAYRVEEFKRMVVSGKHRNRTLLALALDCGFSSKASFNSSFKKLTQTTPSEFVKSIG